MKKKKFIIGGIAVALSAVMFTQTIPMELLETLAEEIVEVFEVEETIPHEQEENMTGGWSDKGNVGSGYIIEEDVSKRTLTTKEFVMSDDTRMIQQFAEPVHYYENGEYKEIEKSLVEETTVEKETAESSVADSTIKSTRKKHFTYASVSENGKTVVNGKEVYAGKKDGSAKNDVFFRFELPKTEKHYALVGAKLNFQYETKGASLFDRKKLNYNVYVADSKTELSNITYDSKPAKLQELTAIEDSTMTEETAGYTSENISVSNIQNDTLTIGVETTSETSEDGYIALATAAETMCVTYTYRTVVGLDDSYSMERFEIDGATAYVHNVAGCLTLACDLASFNTLTDMPFEASLIYNTHNDEVLTNYNKPAMFGNNFKLNFQQYMLKSADGNYYEWIDADGSITTFYQSETAGFYRAKSQNLYFREDSNETGVLFDAQNNEVYFANGRPTIIMGLGTPQESIVISYDATNVNQINQVSYTDKANTYQLVFEYANGKAQTVKKQINSTVVATYNLTYDGEKLIGITHVGANVNLLYFSYGNGLTYVTNAQKEVLHFEPQSGGTKIEKVSSMQGIGGSTTDLRCYSYAQFTYQECTNTTIKYYQDDKLVGEKHIAFNNAQSPISEWYVDENGDIAFSNQVNWGNVWVREYGDDYIQETVQYTHTEPTTIAKTLSGVASETFTISNEDLSKGVNNPLYKHALNFKVTVTSTTYNIIDLTVVVGDSMYDIDLEYGGEVYVSIPCGYLTANTFRIASNDYATYSISDIHYTVIDYTKTTSALLTDTTLAVSEQRYGIKSSVGYTKGGDYTSTVYNERQLPASTVAQGMDAPTVIEITTYEYYTDFEWTKNKPKKVITKETVGIATAEKTRTEYQYSKSVDGLATTTTATTTSGTLKTQTQYIVNKMRTPHMVTQVDENGQETTAYYEQTYGDNRLAYVIYGNTKETYGYNELGQVTSMSVVDRTSNTVIHSQTNSYVNGTYTGSTYGGSTYGYTYDSTGLITSITDNNKTMLGYTYNSNDADKGKNAVKEKTYANGQTAYYSYYANSMSVSYESEWYDYIVNNAGEVTSQRHYADNERKISYSYNKDNVYAPTLRIDGLEYPVTYTTKYNEYTERLENIEVKFIGSCVTSEIFNGVYTYDREGRLASSSYGEHKTSLGYDTLGRVTSYVTHYDQREIQDKSYVYATNGGYATNRLTQIVDNNTSTVESTATYDGNGRISGITYGSRTSAYTYDGAGRLISETTDGVTRNYTYDGANNIQASGLTYTNGKLTSVNGAAIEYDDLGNPTTYKGNTFVWTQGRKLASGSIGWTDFAYTYDGNGMRYEKDVDGEITEYYYNGTQLIAENREYEGRIYYIYDATGIAGMIYNYQYYYFDKNVLGDVVAIRNASGTVVGEYLYDAWGNIDYLYGSIAEINPFRYRGYYYDTETGFYYLQTRYYDPEIMRFINADDYELVAELSSVVGQLNMYAYCGNNPIMYTDPTGEILWISALIGGVIGAAFGGISAYISGENVWAGILIGGLTGALSGGLGFQFLGNFAMGFLSNVANSYVNNQEVNLNNAFLSGILSGALSTLKLNVFQNVPNLTLQEVGKETVKNTMNLMAENILLDLMISSMASMAAITINALNSGRDIKISQFYIVQYRGV